MLCFFFNLKAMSSTDHEEVTLPFHHHPLSCGTFESYTFRSILSIPKLRNGIYNCYHCKECSLTFHKEWADSFFSQQFICNHVLKIFRRAKTPLVDSTDDHFCHFCRSKLKLKHFRCTICNISVGRECVKDPPPLTIYQPKHHKHSLTLLLRLVTFTCNACGVEDDRNPYVCLECNLMVHKYCIEKLPRVISINRHDHRINHTFHLGQGEGDKECGVCRKKINWAYGGYECSRCPSYAVHSRCATRREVWDGLELEDVPEEEEEIEDPFKVVNEKGDIVHFCHEEHVLRLDENYVTDNVNMRCRCCVLAIDGDPCYRCLECDFILHEKCANLPRKMRHLLHNHKLSLEVSFTRFRRSDNFFYTCIACQTHTDGFIYACHDGLCRYLVKSIKYDVRCSSVSEPFHHDLHQHPLYFTLQSSRQCQACGTKIDHDPLSCTVCDDYSLCMRCTTLPRKVKHRCDDHFLSLCQGSSVNDSGDLWCDICETKTDPSVCYYTCDECGLSLHIDCVLGDLYYLKLGIPEPDVEICPNNEATRPLCSGCKVRCKNPFFIRSTEEEPASHACSIDCS
ncbi:Cysteine/Histidine-rich C1 domain family protein [Arabidopsis thaliana]|nr:Cysteine/Histidine-rich C1 domain family protein [Arabidopsis thaliana]AED96439.2 Cysteine/Histidine-rich C1 domain family protein [Arabidopsis thaliana]|eukprot:NP_200213.2 Cysteine/Histidine-rich C1 domain family protein [Arabidopsis thaliana]